VGFSARGRGRGRYRVGANGSERVGWGVVIGDIYIFARRLQVCDERSRGLSGQTDRRI